jgi:hypothetical protein
MYIEMESDDELEEMHSLLAGWLTLTSTEVLKGSLQRPKWHRSRPFYIARRISASTQASHHAFVARSSLFFPPISLGAHFIGSPCSEGHSPILFLHLGINPMHCWHLSAICLFHADAHVLVNAAQFNATPLCKSSPVIMCI